VLPAKELETFLGITEGNVIPTGRRLLMDKSSAPRTSCRGAVTFRMLRKGAAQVEAIKKRALECAAPAAALQASYEARYAAIARRGRLR
jgi:hypothetical protein